MAINNSYDEKAVVQAIAKALETFYGTLIEKIDTESDQEKESISVSRESDGKRLGDSGVCFKRLCDVQ